MRQIEHFGIMENTIDITVIRECTYDNENEGTEKFNIFWGANPVDNELLDRDNLIRLRDRINAALGSDDSARESAKQAELAEQESRF